jgi:septum formation protein
MAEPELLLASTSRWRRAILESAGIRTRCVAPGVDERAVHIEDPVALVQELAYQKAAAVAKRYPSSWVLGADQMLFDAIGVWGKPANPQEHLERLCAMRGESHKLATGFCVMRGEEPPVIDVEITTLHVRIDLTEAELRAYVATGEGSQCAGGYAIEGRGAFLFSSYEGDYTNILGLPIFRVFDVLRRQGWRFEDGE